MIHTILKLCYKLCTKEDNPHQTFLQQKKLKIYLHVDIGFPTYAPSFEIPIYTCLISF